MKKRLISTLTVVCMLVVAIPFVGLPATAESDINVAITKTGIRADSVYNTQGYGGLKINSTYADDGEFVLPKAALINDKGEFLFEFRDTWLKFIVSNDKKIVSLTGDIYTNYFLEMVSGLLFDPDAALNAKRDTPKFYNMDGTEAFDCSSISSALPMFEDYTPAYLDCFTNDCRAVILDRSGKTVYTFPDYYSELGSVGGAYVSGGDYYATNSSGLIRDYREGLIATSEGYIDAFGNVKISLEYDNIYDFCGSYAVVFKRNYEEDTFGYGFIDKEGNNVIPCMYYGAGGFGNDGLAKAVDFNKKCGYINAKNEVVIPFEYDEAYGADDGLAAVGINGKFGFVDYNNNVVVPLEYDDISDFSGGIAYAIKDGYVYIIKLIDGPFNDISYDAWYTKGVLYCYEHGYLSGTGNRIFSPNDYVTRAMFVTILSRIDGADLSAYSKDTAGLPFTDVKASWYIKSLKWAYEHNYTSGLSATLFGPNDSVTREQLAVFLYSYSKLKGYDVSKVADFSTFADSGKVAKWAKTGVGWAINSGLIAGTGNNMLSPKTAATRAQVATIIMKYDLNVNIKSKRNDSAEMAIIKLAD